jgi:hypothetical protein
MDSPPSPSVTAAEATATANLIGCGDLSGRPTYVSGNRLNFFISLLCYISCPISLNDPDGDISMVGPPTGVTRLDGQ